MTPQNMQEAREITDGFFIGGGLDTTENANFTKDDLAFSISEALSKAEARGRLAGLEEGAKVIMSDVKEGDDSLIAKYCRAKAQAIRSRQRSSK